MIAHPTRTQGRARPREDAPTLVLGALSFNPSHRSSAGNRRNAPSRGEVPSRGLQANRCRAMGCGPTAHSRLDAGLKGALLAGVWPYPAREGVRRRSNLNTLRWSVFPRHGAGGFSPQILIPDNTAPRRLPYAGSINPTATRQTYGVSDEGYHSLVLGRPADRDHRALLFRLLLGQGKWAVGRWPTPPMPLNFVHPFSPNAPRTAEPKQRLHRFHRDQSARGGFGPSASNQAGCFHKSGQDSGGSP